MSSRSIWVGIVLAAALAACGGDDKGSSTSSSGGSSSGSTSSSGGSSSGSTADTDAGSTPAPKAVGPKMVSIMKMTGALHVSWELPDTCDGVELERKDGDAAEFKVAYKLPGTVDNKHDGAATENLVYTYRARCKVGAEYTEYSNEMSKNPQK